jgi:tetratricopeptide (TPR) repeat protein
LRYSQNVFTNNPVDLEEAAGELGEVTRLAPRFAPAYASLAEACLSEARFHYRPALEAFADAHRNAARALEIDGANLTARTVLATLLAQEEWKWDEAGVEFRRVLANSHDDPRALFGYAAFLAQRGDLNGAIKVARKGLDRVPNSQGGRTLLARLYYYNREYRRAVDILHERPRVDEHDLDPDLLEVDIQLAMGDVPAAWRAWELSERRLVKDHPTLSNEFKRVRIYAAEQDRASALAFQERDVEVARGTGLAPLLIAENYCALGMRDEAIEWIDRAVAQHDPDIGALVGDSIFDPVRNDARFTAALKRIGSK